MSSILLTIADAVVHAIAEGAFAEGLTPTRAVRAIYDLDDFKTTRVTVVPRTLDISPLTRGGDQYDAEIQVLVQRQVKTDGDDQIDEVLSLAESIADHLRGAPLERVPGLGMVAIQHSPLLVPEHIDQFNLATSVITINYALTRARMARA